MAAAKVLTRKGAAVTISDARPPWELRADMRDLLAHKIGVEMGQHREETFLNQDLIVVSPGVLPQLPQLQAASAHNIPVVSEVEAASWFLESPIIGITGSNGKTTTTSLLGEILEDSAFPTFVGGNIGVPLISAVGDVPKDAFVVTELSSFQLEATQTFRPRVAVMLNITPNHLDRHPTLEAYVQAKSQIFKNQTPEDFTILNADDPAVMRLAPFIAARKVFFSRRRELPDGVFVTDGHIVYRVGNLERLLMTTREIQLRGEFNVENVLAASAAACVVGANFEAIRRGVSAFRGVEHRLEFVREIRGVQFYNDSKATSVDAAAKALSAFTRGVHLILGGKDKGAPYAPIRTLIEGRVRFVYLIGAAAQRIEKELRGAVGLIHSGDLETAVHEAFRRAETGDVVLLSPACASFDQFQDYEHRGRMFKEIVARLAERSGHGGRESAGRLRELGLATKEAAFARLAEPSAPEPSREPEEPTIPAQLVEPVAEPRATSPEPRVSAPERIFIYEAAAEEIEYPEAEILVDRGEPDQEAVSVEHVLTPETLEDEALPFEVRPMPGVAVATPEADGSAEERSATSASEGNGSGATPPNGRNRFPGQ